MTEADGFLAAFSDGWTWRQHQEPEPLYVPQYVAWILLADVPDELIVDGDTIGWRGFRMQVCWRDFIELGPLGLVWFRPLGRLNQRRWLRAYRRAVSR